jgi:O-antigen/teichoic acid export membrane protein
MIGNIIALVVTAFVSSYSARMIRIIKENDFKNVSDIITTLMQDDARYVGLMVGGIFVMASFLVAILGRGEGYNNAVLVVCGIALGHFARSIYLFFQNYLFYRHRSIELFGLNALLLIIGGGIIWMMAEMYEIVGVAFVNVISYVIMIPIGWFICSKWSRIQFPVAALRQTVFGLSLLLACEFFIKTMGILMHDPVFWLIKVLEVGVVWVVWRRSLNGLFIMIPKRTRT